MIDEDPLDPMITRLRTGRELPFDWVIEHAGDGDVVAATTRLYAASSYGFSALAFHAGVDTMTFARATTAALLACTKFKPSSRRVQRDYTSRLQRWIAAADYPALVARARELLPRIPTHEKVDWDELVLQLLHGSMVFAEDRARGEMSYLVETCCWPPADTNAAIAFRRVVTPAMIMALVRLRLVPGDAECDTLAP